MEASWSFEPSGTTCPMTECHIPEDLYLPHANFFTTLNFNKQDKKRVVNLTVILLHGTNKSYLICIWEYKNRGHSTVRMGATFLSGWHIDWSNDTVSNRQQHMLVTIFNATCQMYTHTHGQVTQRYKTLWQWHELESYVAIALTLHKYFERTKWNRTYLNHSKKYNLA